jgi:tRNA (cmo5U34)-methyltransferase
MAAYRWNVPDFAAGYDQAAATIHPHYVELQDEILKRLAAWLAELPGGAAPRIVDLGGGSGRLVERCLEKFPQARATVVDQSEAFLAVAERKLERFGDRAMVSLCRLQDWTASFDSPAAIVSMSAIHHLTPEEKQVFYARCFAALARGGLLINADEVRPAGDAEYLRELQAWWKHMETNLASGAIPAAMRPILESWRERNIDRFSAPKKSGDDCHETVEQQLEYLSRAGFERVVAPWRRGMWAVMIGQRPA